MSSSSSSVTMNENMIRQITRMAVREGVETTAMLIRDQAKRDVAVDTGRLRGSIDYTITESGNKISAKIGTNVDYASAIEFGTSSHTIVPVTARALSWIDRTTGQRRYATRVQMPARPARPYLIPAFNTHSRKLNLIVGEAIRRRMSGLA